MTWIECGPEHLEAIRAIFNDAIAHTTALYEDEPRSSEFMETWWRLKQQGQFPVIGALDEGGTLMGFATYGPFRPHPGYRFTLEHSIYVDARFRGRGLGRRFLERLIESAQAQGYRTLIGVIDAENRASIRLHERLGFSLCATLHQVGFKFGRWLDVVMYERVLS
ncbi:GNAT family N-acetyltransferase [Prosthecobacter debontii]